MNNGKTGLFSTIFMLVEKFAPIYVEYLTHKRTSEKILRTDMNLVRQLGTMIVASLVLATISWVLLMGLLFIYLQTFQLPIILVLLILLGINLGLLFIVIARISNIKKKILN